MALRNPNAPSDVNALVLGGVPYGDRSRIVRLLTEEHGVVALWVANARKDKGLWHPMAALQVAELTQKKGQGLWQGRGVHRAMPQLGLRNSPERTAVAFFVAECLALVLHEEGPAEEAFHLALDACMLVESAEDVSMIPVHFMAHLVQTLGLLPPVAPPSAKGFNVETGEYVWGLGEGKHVLDVPVIAAMVAIPGTKFDDLRAMNLTRVQRKELALGAFRYMRSQLGLHRELKSYEVLEALFA